jgi:hypothetical protein
MLSICIPVYNYDCRQLIINLQSQIEKNDLQAEINIINDGSGKEYDLLYSKFCNGKSAKNLNYTSLDINRGRSSVRNLLGEQAKYNHLLFLDCDSELISEDFLKLYIQNIDEGVQVICGGRIYPDKCIVENKFLHWKYGISKESKSVNERLAHPFKSFMTNNFLIQKKVFEKIKFDETIYEYGHEDTLFGFYLEKNGINIRHIDNPVLHGYIEDNDVFLDKTKKAVKNLVNIIRSRGIKDKDFVNTVSLSRTYFQIRSYRLSGLLYFTSRIFIQPLLKKIRKNKGGMMGFSIYKLFLFAQYFYPTDCKTVKD